MDAEWCGGVLNLITSKVAGAQNISDGYNGTARATASTKGYGGGLFEVRSEGKALPTVNLQYEPLKWNRCIDYRRAYTDKRQR